MTETAMVPTTTPDGWALAEQVVIKGDLSKLSEEQRMAYYTEVCRSLGLNPMTRPFEFITLSGKLTLYATRGAADQLRNIRGITITDLEPRQVGDLLVVVATGRDRTGREDSSTGAVAVKGLQGEALANAMMKAETKAKRRLTLSLAGLGWSDETEVADIPGAVSEPPKTLAERVAEKAAEVTGEATAEDDDAVWEAAIEAVKSEPGMTMAEFTQARKDGFVPSERVQDAGQRLYPGRKLSDLSDRERLALWLEVQG